MLLKNIDYHIIDKCNLNCKSCNHFSPLVVNDNVIDPHKAENDFEILKKFENRFKLLTILGGEALLNKYISDILVSANQHFPNKIKLITNGVLKNNLILLKPVICSNNIQLTITEYPFIKEYRKHYDKLKELFPFAEFYTFRHEHGFISEHMSYNVQNTKKDLLLKCDKRNKCCNYVDGRLYICHYAAFINNLKNITNIDFSNNDSYIDLTKCSAAEFDDFFNEQIPEICEHCLYVKKPYEQLNKSHWELSKKEAHEWIK